MPKLCTSHNDLESSIRIAHNASRTSSVNCISFHSLLTPYYPLDCCRTDANILLSLYYVRIPTRRIYKILSAISASAAACASISDSALQFSCSCAFSVRDAGRTPRAYNPTAEADERKRQGLKLSFRAYCVHPISCLFLAMHETTRSPISSSSSFFELMYTMTAWRRS